MSFQVAKNQDKTLEALDRACDCYKQINSLYQAAKMLEQAVLICRDIQKLDKVVEYAERGGLLYRQHGSPEAAAQLLEKAAKIVEPKHPEKALSLYTKAAETITTEDRPKEASDFLTKVARLQARLKRWDDAVETLKQTIGLQQESGRTMVTGRLAASLVLVHLAREDQVAANKAYQEVGGWCDSDLNPPLRQILNGFEEMDRDAVKQGLASQGIRNLDIEFARMAAKDIPLPEDGGGLEAAASAFGAERAAALNTKDIEDKVDQMALAKEEEESKPPVAPVVQEDEDDEDEGLC